MSVRRVENQKYKIVQANRWTSNEVTEIQFIWWNSENRSGIEPKYSNDMSNSMNLKKMSRNSFTTLFLFSRYLLLVNIICHEWSLISTNQKTSFSMLLCISIRNVESLAVQIFSFRMIQNHFHVPTMNLFRWRCHLNSICQQISVVKRWKWLTYVCQQDILLHQNTASSRNEKLGWIV